MWKIAKQCVMSQLFINVFATKKGPNYGIYFKIFRIFVPILVRVMELNSVFELNSKLKPVKIRSNSILDQQSCWHGRKCLLLILKGSQKYLLHI